MLCILDVLVGNNGKASGILDLLVDLLTALVLDWIGQIHKFTCPENAVVFYKCSYTYN